MSTSSNPQTFQRFHDAYRHFRAHGFSKIESLKSVRMHYPELNRIYCLAQENHEPWALEALDMTDEKKARNLSIIQNGGRLP